MKPPLFLIVTDAHFYPGALAAATSIAIFHPEAKIAIVDHCGSTKGLTDLQRDSFINLGVEVFKGTEFATGGRKSGAWELKAYAADALSANTDILVGIDADCVLCNPMHDLIELCNESEGFFGGKDGEGPRYGNEYGVYGFDVPSWNNKYMSTSLYLCKSNPTNRAILNAWAECCSRSVFGGTGVFPGHGDQGVLNALLFRERASITLLDNHLWSQHWVYWQSPLEVQCNRLFNTEHKQYQRSIHAGGTEKPWTLAHKRRLQSFPHIRVNYAWFLKCLEVGCSRSGSSPEILLGRDCAHLVQDIQSMHLEISQLHLDETSRCIPFAPRPKKPSRNAVTKHPKNIPIASSADGQAYS